MSNFAPRRIDLTDRGAQEADCVVVTTPNATTEVYTYKTGGTSGTTKLVVTTTYTDATKSQISTVVRTLS
jgi:hypothetical protein